MEYVQSTQAILIKATLRNSKEFCAAGRFVRQHWSHLAQGNRAAEEALHRRLRPTLRAINVQLPGHLNAFSTPLYQPCTYLRLFEEQGVKVEVINLPVGSQIPSHDHPQSIGLNHLLNGTVWMIQADRSHPECYRRCLLNAEDTCFTFPDRNNIHGFYTATSEATLISINFHHRENSHDSKRWSLITDLVADITARPKIPVRNAVMLFVLSSIAQPALAAECIMSKAQQELVRENFQSAALLLNDCADKGLMDAQRKLGDLYLTGRGVERDAYTAAQWYRKAALQGDIHAQYNYGIMLLDGNGITEDNIEGFDWIYEAARSGHTRAKQVFEYIQANPAPLEC